MRRQRLPREEQKETSVCSANRCIGSSNYGKLPVGDNRMPLMQACVEKRSCFDKHQPDATRRNFLATWRHSSFYLRRSHAGQWVANHHHHRKTMKMEVAWLIQPMLRPDIARYMNRTICDHVWPCVTTCDQVTKFKIFWKLFRMLGNATICNIFFCQMISTLCDHCIQIVTIYDQVLIIGQKPFESFKPYIAAGQWGLSPLVRVSTRFGLGPRKLY